MTACIKDLYDYGSVKQCCRCKLICLKSNFYKSKNMSDGLHPQCLSCEKKIIYWKSIENKKILFRKSW